MQVFGMDLVYFCAKDTALEFSSLWCFCGSGSTTQSVCFSNLSWPYPWVKRYETSAGNPAWLTYAQPQFVILCAGDMTDSIFFYVFLLDSRHDDRKIGTLNSQKESTGRSGRLEIGRDAKFGGCCKLATFTWRCLIDLDWIRWLFMFLPPEGEAPTSSAGTAMSAFWNSLVGGRDERVYITISLCVPFVDCKWLQCGRELDLTCCGYDMRCRLLKWCT